MSIVNEPYGQLGYLLTQVSFLKQRMVNNALRKLDITYMQFIILAGTLELGKDGTAVTQQDLSRERRLNKAMVSNVVKHLSGKGLMQRRQHPLDKRAYILTLTDQGTCKALQGKQIAFDIDRIFFARIDRDDLLATLTTLLEQEGGEHE